MNLDTIDEFLYEKSLMCLDMYFGYLQKGFDIIDWEKKEVPKEQEHLLTEYFGKEVIKYQVVSTALISEIFHIIETFLKSNLLRSGEYFLYQSIDRFPEQKEKLDNLNKAQKEELQKLMVDKAKAIVKNKESRVTEISKRL